MFNEYQHLRIPGPTPISPEVQREMNRTILGHRSAEFSEIIASTMDQAKYIFQTEGDVFILASSGTGALEMAVANTVEAGDKVLVIVTGVFGERFVKIANSYRAEVLTLKYDFGEAANPKDVKEMLEEHPDIKAVFTTQCETSTAVANPIEEIGKVVKESNALLIVDAVSALVGMNLEMDSWAVDIAVTASHKALGLPPGLALIGVSEKAWEVVNNHKGPRFYFDLMAYKKSAGKNTTPFTGPVNLVFGLSKSIELIQQEGLQNTFKRHTLIRDMLRAAMLALNLELFVKDQAAASCTVTSIKGKEDLDVEAFRKVLLKDYKVVTAGGQQDLKGKIFRIGHMGYIFPLDIITTISAVEMALKQIGYPVTLGTGVKAAEEVWINAKNINK